MKARDTDLSILLRFRRFRLRTLFICLTCFCALMAYSGTYYQLSRRGMVDAAEYEMDGFLYVPLHDVLASEDLSAHYRYCVVFAPVSWVDRNIFSGPSPIACIMFRLS